ncbi:MAG: carotenoid 1,2-hydratase [Aquabacterium sp.]
MDMGGHGASRRHWLAMAGALVCPMGATRAAPAAPPTDQPAPSLRASEPLRFPHDHGAHPATRTEWWYVTGEIDAIAPGEQPLGFQITFFRSRVDVARDNPSRFAPRQLVFAHAALSDARRGQLLHDQRIARAGFGLVDAAEGDTRLQLRDWTLSRTGPVQGGAYTSRIRARSFALDLRLTPTQPPILQGEQGFSRKAPQAAYATRYYSLPHLQLSGRIRLRGQDTAVTGRAWLDHEWGETVLSPDAVGWDWLGIHLQDGGALMVFRTRRQDGSVVWQGGTWRRPGQPDRTLAPAEIRMVPGATWLSPASGARYPVGWTLHLAGHTFTVRARMPNQELDGLYSTGSIYWEGLCDLIDAQGRTVGSGYLEMTGYASPMSL